MGKLRRGLVQVYTGGGKGKTTAALGLALRALGHGMRACMVQFMKGGGKIGERRTAERLAPELVIHSFGGERRRGPAEASETIPWWQLPPPPEEKEAAAKGLEFARGAIAGGEYDVVILDEVNTAIALGVLPLDDVLALVRGKPEGVELILTGRNARPEVVELADLVTEMREVKHPFRQGVKARKGIEF
jgi:cob(I)alamin adenosyltransferase